ncbi:glycosyltransferase [Spirosoma rhododendri]|uniref:Glycosyltransferase n=1 Tax=Spirosoma rhododendri TaxID=2728024 RepID=A0A7L5DNI0_9BACT|nr:glycosyltransferase [Spirosoma rhododendri]QJD80019.1 glycosyltransferase [Spirosoma rhododendri]
MTIADSGSPSLSEPDPTLFSACPPPHPHLQVSVIVPARNEAHHLTETLDALRGQYRSDGNPLSTTQYEVLLLLNNCTDASEQVARQYQQTYPAFPLYVEAIQLPVSMANVGTARRLLMNEACRRLQRVNPMQGIIASTDGDTVVDSQWLYQILNAIREGNEAVGGRILTRPDGGSVRLNHLRDVTYRMLIAQVEAQLDPQPNDPWPRHFQHFGANMAVTCTAYLRAGGLPNVPHLEDEAFYRALLRTDARIRKSPAVRVFTSTRLNGQATIGFAEQLRYWQQQNQQQQHQLAEPADGIVHRLRCRQQLRAIWQQRQQSNAPTLALPLSLVASSLSLSVDSIGQLLAHCRYFGEFWEQIEQRISSNWATRYPPVAITRAIADLRRCLNGSPVLATAEQTPGR